MNQVLSPIWDAVDEEQWSYALQLIDKALKRYRVPDPTILGLQGLCLVKEGRVNEAIEVCEKIRAIAPKSKDIYQTIHDTFKTSPSQLAADYLVNTMEKGFMETKSEFMGRLWFMEAVKAGQLQAQRKAAIELQKGFLSRDYFYLVIMSMYLLHQRSEGKDKQLLGMLMERMISKAASNVPDGNSAAAMSSPQSGPRIETVEEFYLYLDILRTMGKDEDALAALDGPHGTIYATNHEFMLLRLELLATVEGPRSRETRQFTQQCIEKGVDDWIVWKAYVDSIDPTDEAIRIASLNFLDVSLNTIASRNAKLVKVYLGFQGLHMEDIVNSLTSYFEAFPDKLVTFEDLAPYVSRCNSEQQQSFLTTIRSVIPESGISQIISKTNVLKFEILLSGTVLNQPDSLPGQSDLIGSALSVYADSLKFGGDLKETDNQYGDDLLLIATQLLCNDRGSRLPKLRQAIVLFEFAVSRSKHNFQFKLQLISLYRRIGAWSSAQAHFASLGIRHIQRDTLSHILLESSASEYISTLQLSSLKDSQNIYLANQVETPEVICQAYSYRTYSKIAEFLIYQERLAKSVWKIESDLQIWELQILLDKFEWQTTIDSSVFDGPLYDNKSHNVLLNVHSHTTPGCANDKENKLVQIGEKERLRRSMRTLQSIQAVIRSDEAIVTLHAIADPDHTKDAELQHRLVSILYTAKFDQFTSPMQGLRNLADSISVPETDSTHFDGTHLQRYGSLVTTLKYYAVLLPFLKSIKDLSPTTKFFTSLATTLRTTLDTLRRQIASSPVSIDLDLLKLIGGDMEFSEVMERRIRSAQSESINCLLSVLKGIKL